MSIRERLADEMKSAMRARDKLRLETIRMIRAEILVKDKETGEAASDAEIVRILQSMVKKRHDAAAQFREGKREELAEKGIEPSEIRVDTINGKKYRVFFAQEPFGVCFCFGRQIDDG